MKYEIIKLSGEDIMISSIFNNEESEMFVEKIKLKAIQKFPSEFHWDYSPYRTWPPYFLRFPIGCRFIITACSLHILYENLEKNMAIAEQLINAVENE